MAYGPASTRLRSTIVMSERGPFVLIDGSARWSRGPFPSHWRESRRQPSLRLDTYCGLWSVVGGLAATGYRSYSLATGHRLPAGRLPIGYDRYVALDGGDPFCMAAHLCGELLDVLVDRVEVVAGSRRGLP